MNMISNRRECYVIIYWYLLCVLLYLVNFVYIILFMFNRKNFYLYINIEDKNSGDFMYGYVVNLMNWMKIMLFGVCCWFFFCNLLEVMIY